MGSLSCIISTKRRKSHWTGLYISYSTSSVLGGLRETCYFIKEAWQRKKVVVALALDAQGAFNNVVHEKMLEDCREVGISEYLIRWTRSFLQGSPTQR